MGIDPFTGALIGGLGSALIGSRSSRRAAGQIAGASDAATAEQRRQFDIAMGLAQPGIQAGDAARAQLLNLLGIGRGTAGVGNAALGTQVGRGGFPTNPGVDLMSQLRGPFGALARRARGPTGGFGSLARDPMGGEFGGPGLLPGGTPRGGTASADPLDVIRNTPGYNFQLEQGTRALNANRSAGGISGGELLRDFSRFNQGVASSFYQDYANRLANLAGTGQTAAANQGNLAVQTGANIGNTLINAGNARASGILGQGNAFSGFLEQLAGGFGSGFGFGINGGTNTGGRGGPRA